MPTTFLVDDATNTPFTSGSAGVQVVVGTATSINGSPVGALAGLVGNFALDTSTNTLWACTASGTSGSAQWEQVLTDPSLYALINGSSGQVFNVADATQDSEAVNLGQLTDGSLSPTFNGGLFTGILQASRYNIAGQSLTYSNTGLSIGWNFTNSDGEVDLLLGPQSGAGGLNIYQLNSSGTMVSTTPIMALSNTGALTLQGTVSASAGTSGNELINYTQMTDGSLSPSFASGSFSGQLSIPDATASGSAINYGQAFQLLSGAPPSSITLGNTLHTVAKFSLSAATSVTLEPGSVVGQKITIYGGAYALTVNSNVTSGFPYFVLPDGSNVYSWTIPANEYDQGIKLIWDGTNWRARTFGQTVVAPAVEDNQAPQLGQFIAPFGNMAESSTATSLSVSTSFTAPCNGSLVAFFTCSASSSETVNNITISATGATAVTAGIPLGDGTIQGNDTATYSCDSGAAVTITGSATSSAGLYLNLFCIFIPGV